MRIQSFKKGQLVHMSEHVSKDVLAERGVLASIFDDPEVFPVVSELLGPDDFYESSNQIIYAVMLSMYQSGEAIGVVQVQHYLSRAGNLAQAGGLQYLLELTNPEAPYAYVAALLDYVKIVRENSDLRKLQKAVALAEEKTRPGSGYDFNQALNFAESALHDVSEVAIRSEISRVADHIDDEFAAMIERGNMPDGVATGVPSGFTELDDKTTGFHPGQMVIIGARPAMGKSTLAVDFARGAAIRAGKSVLFFSLEMGKEEITQRVLSAESLVELQKIRSGKNLTSDDWARLKRSKKELSESNLFIDDNPNLSLVDLRTKAMRQANTPAGLDLIVVDYLQLMETTKGTNLSREQLISEISRGVKLLAKELELPIIILCQLNRGTENRSDKVPLASDLRESGSLEQDADMVFLLHRPEAYDPNDRPGQADLIIAKQRNGPTGKVVLVPLLNVSKFASATGIFPADFVEPVPAEEAPEDTGYDPYALPKEDPYGELPPSVEDPFGPPSNSGETIVPMNNLSSGNAGSQGEKTETAW